MPASPDPPCDTRLSYETKQPQSSSSTNSRSETTTATDDDRGGEGIDPPIVTLSRHLMADYRDESYKNAAAGGDGYGGQGYITAEFDSEFDSDSEASDFSATPKHDVDDGPRHVSKILSPDIVPRSSVEDSSRGNAPSMVATRPSAVTGTQPSLWLDLSDMLREATELVDGLVQQAKGFQFPESCQRNTYHVLPEDYPQTARDDQIFLCPYDALPSDLGPWPAESIMINGSACMDRQEFGLFHNQETALECYSHVTDDVTKIMDQLEMPVFLVSGSLLGWYRHNQSQIPWDLDADVGLMRDDCDASFKRYGGDFDNILDLLQNKMGPGYHIAARQTGIGNELPSDSFLGCNTDEFYVRTDYKGQTCHVDVWMLSQQDKWSADSNQKCKCPDSVPFPRVCRWPDACNTVSDLVPPTWSTQTGGNFTAQVMVPNKPIDVLQNEYGNIALYNMKRVPANYNFHDYALVVGDPLDWDSVHSTTYPPILWDELGNPLFRSIFGTSVRERTVLDICIGVVLCVLLLLICCLIAYCIIKRKRAQHVAYTSLEMQPTTPAAADPTTTAAVDDEV
ncbi:hypothetical protein FOZ61_002050 [Perkinsus olseni]|uniref:LicD/FKTN/FKRP nucleotidyltransferase domain-containing protein n=1 Tax=Perkinsus olseni TaxID=32597 RepID=A0A7J6LUM8_PEROL|nr:hypothetical protein FOZ61_002050 [Perkinsus olseni]